MRFNFQHLTLHVPPGGKQGIGEFRAAGEMAAVVSLSGTNVPARAIEIRADTVWVKATPGGMKVNGGAEQRLCIVATLNAFAGTAGGVIGVNVCANVTGPWGSRAKALTGRRCSRS